MYELLDSFEKVGWIVWIGHTWFYSILSVLHYFTIFWMVGTITLIDLRVLGLVGMRQTATEWKEQLAPWMWTALAICLTSGFLEFLPGGGDYYMSDVFKAKFIATAVGIILAVVVYRNIPKWDKAPSMPGSAKVLAALCLLVWFGTILLGVEVANYGFF